jgi:signal transduction histidine kinase
MERETDMQAMETAVAGITERRRMEAVVETLAAMHSHGESLAALAHDARNMVTALSLYCDLLEEPGVLSAPHRHYASELRLVAEASRRLVEKLALLEAGEGSSGQGAPRLGSDPVLQGRLFPKAPDPAFPWVLVPPEPTSSDSGPAIQPPTRPGLRPDSRPEPLAESFSAAPIEDFRSELLSSRNLLAAIAGPSITVTATAGGGAWPVWMTSENLIRALVNLVKNSAEAIAGPGSIELHLDECRDGSGAVRELVLSIEDSGPGIAEELLEKVFEPGFTTRANVPDGRWITGHRGLGLSIARSIAQAAGGRIRAENRTGAETPEQPGTRFVIELPVRS